MIKSGRFNDGLIRGYPSNRDSVFRQTTRSALQLKGKSIGIVYGFTLAIILHKGAKVVDSCLPFSDASKRDVSFTQCHKKSWGHEFESMKIGIENPPVKFRRLFLVFHR